MKPPGQSEKHRGCGRQFLHSHSAEAFFSLVLPDLAQTSKEIWKSILSWWAAGSSSSMGARRFLFSSERLSARLRGREDWWREEEAEEKEEEVDEGGCGCRS